MSSVTVTKETKNTRTYGAAAVRRRVAGPRSKLRKMPEKDTAPGSVYDSPTTCTHRRSGVYRDISDAILEVRDYGEGLL